MTKVSSPTEKYVAVDWEDNYYRFKLPLNQTNDNFSALNYISKRMNAHFLFCVPTEFKEYYEGKNVEDLEDHLV